MPVLKQLFNKWGFIIKDDWDRDTLVISYDKFIELQKEWLKQYRQEIGNKIYSDHRFVAETIYDELLAELEEGEKRPIFDDFFDGLIAGPEETGEKQQ